MEAENLPVDLHIIISDIIQGSGHVDDLFPFFLRHAKQMFPHLDCMDDLKKISDLRQPANWYSSARAINRKIIFHSGPTNSGKTYHAMERLLTAKSGVYCGPLKLLAAEVFHKANLRGTDCDLVTGEERKYAKENQTPSAHVACTVEMTSVNTPCEYLHFVFRKAPFDPINYSPSQMKWRLSTRSNCCVIRSEDGPGRVPFSVSSRRRCMCAVKRVPLIC